MKSARRKTCKSVGRACEKPSTTGRARPSSAHEQERSRRTEFDRVPQLRKVMYATKTPLTRRGAAGACARRGRGVCAACEGGRACFCARIAETITRSSTPRIGAVGITPPETCTHARKRAGLHARRA
eukprot:4849942-Pleurochrysis_carterae.AAC.3